MKGKRELIVAAQNADWGQVVANGGPPCFHLHSDENRFCLRAERWLGHETGCEVGHAFVSLAALLESESKAVTHG